MHGTARDLTHLSGQVVGVASPLVTGGCSVRSVRLSQSQSEGVNLTARAMSDESPPPAPAAEKSQPAEQAAGGWGGWGLSIFSEISRNVSTE